MRGREDKSDQPTRRGHLAAVHVLVQVEDLVADAHAAVVQLGRDQLGVQRVRSDLRAVHRRGERRGRCCARGVGQLRVLPDTAVEVVVPELPSGCGLALPARWLLGPSTHRRVAIGRRLTGNRAPRADDQHLALRPRGHVRRVVDAAAACLGWRERGGDGGGRTRHDARGRTGCRRGWEWRLLPVRAAAGLRSRN